MINFLLTVIKFLSDDLRQNCIIRQCDNKNVENCLWPFGVVAGWNETGANIFRRLMCVGVYDGCVRLYITIEPYVMFVHFGFMIIPIFFPLGLEKNSFTAILTEVPENS